MTDKKGCGRNFLLKSIRATCGKIVDGTIILCKDCRAREFRRKRRNHNDKF
jgi:hypothetical protein